MFTLCDKEAAAKSGMDRAEHVFLCVLTVRLLLVCVELVCVVFLGGGDGLGAGAVPGHKGHHHSKGGEGSV